MALEATAERRRRPPGRRISDLETHPDAYMTVPAFAEHLNVSDKTVRKWIRAGVLTAVKFHSEWRIRTTDAAPRKLHTFRIDEDLFEGLQAVWERDGIQVSE